MLVIYEIMFFLVVNIIEIVSVGMEWRHFFTSAVY